MWDLLERGHRLAVVLRPSDSEAVEQRVESILQIRERQTGRLLSRPVCLAGDVTQEGLGLRPSEAHWVARNCFRVLHSAAALTFFGQSRADDPWRTNVEGIRHVLNACSHWGIGDLHYISTAYVCGTRQGLIFEKELDCGQTFRNDYEESKFLAEKQVRDADFLKRLTVYRPAVVTGDSVTGYTSTYHGLYSYLKLMSVLVWNTEPDADGRRYTPVQLRMRGDERRNLVPVDWVSAVICRLLETPAAHGGTYHLAPQRPITPQQVIEAGYRYFNSYGVEFLGPSSHPVDSLGDMDRDVRDNTSIYEMYETTDPTFDTTHLLRFAADLPCPEIDQEMLHRFWRYGEQDSWGKRRQEKTEIPYRASDRLQDWLRARSDGHVECPDGSTGARSVHKPLTVNLDVIGPGGGQWHVRLNDGRIREMGCGLSSRAAATLLLDAQQWKQIEYEPSEQAIHRLAAALHCVTEELGQLAIAKMLYAVWPKTTSGTSRRTILTTGTRVGMMGTCQP
jgi:nucleoside-diphosphate-sugar epimerase